MKKAVVAGNSLTDVIKRIEQYPEKGMLAKITEVVPGVGGCVPNTAISLKTLAPWELDVSALSRIGKDENGEFILKTLSRHGVRTDKMRIDPVLPISFTDVMTLPNVERTFFCAAAANAAFGEEDIAADALECDLFHIGYEKRAYARSITIRICPRLVTTPPRRRSRRKNTNTCTTWNMRRCRR